MLTRMFMPKYKKSLLSYSIFKIHLSDSVQINKKRHFNNLNRNVPTRITSSDSEEHKKKGSVLPKITLLNANDLKVTTLEDAQKLAKRRDLKLVKIVDIDTKTHRPVYRLMTGAEYHEDDLKQREKKKAEKLNSSCKGEKVLIVGQNISQHDLQTHCSKVIKWLNKKYEVRIVINGDTENMKKTESISLFLEETLNTYGRIVQKKLKGSDLKFQVLPIKESKTNKKNGTDNSI